MTTGAASAGAAALMLEASEPHSGGDDQLPRRATVLSQCMLILTFLTLPARANSKAGVWHCMQLHAMSAQGRACSTVFLLRSSSRRSLRSSRVARLAEAATLRRLWGTCRCVSLPSLSLRRSLSITPLRLMEGRSMGSSSYCAGAAPPRPPLLHESQPVG